MIRFVLNTDDVETYVSRKSGRLDATGRAWALRHIPRFLIRDPRCLTTTRGADVAGFRPDVARNLSAARRLRIEPAWFMVVPEADDEVEAVLDWVAALPSVDPLLANKLGRISFDQARIHSARWHRRLAARRAHLPDDDPNGIEPVLAADGGRRWVRLISRAALDYEGARMGHCVGEGGYDSFRNRIYSLRDSRNRPHCTVEFDPSRRRVQQAKGRANDDVPAKYRGDVERLLRHLAPRRINSRLTEFVLSEEGEILRLSQAADWAPGVRIRNNLVLTNRTDVAALPERLTIRHSLVVANSTLKSLPRHLTIGQSLVGLALSPIERLPEGLSVRTLNLEDSLVTRLAPGTRILKELTVMHSALRDLPPGLTVGQLLILDGAALNRLPGDLEVAGRRVADLTGRRLPPCVVACGELAYTDMVFEDAGDIAVFGRLSFAGWENPAFPANLTVVGTLDLKHAVLDPTRVNGRVTVHGDLDLRGTEIGHLPETWTVHGRVLRD